MHEINDGGINQFLQRRLNITDAPAPAGTLAPELFAVIQAAVPSQEDDYLRGIRICGCDLATGLVAGQYAVATLRNPAGSRCLVMLDEVIVNFTLTTGKLNLYLEKTNLPSMGSVGTAVLDGRWLGAGTSSSRALAVAGVGNTATAPNIAWVNYSSIRWVTNVLSYNYPQRVVLQPGDMWICYTDGGASPLDVALRWRERAAQPSELV